MKCEGVKILLAQSTNFNPKWMSDDKTKWVCGGNGRGGNEVSGGKEKDKSNRSVQNEDRKK